jgi:succinate dehydrogenase / fumarate reductase flavoprotein subunit
MYERFSDIGVDLAEEPVEVAPTAHYGMGGVVVDGVGETAVGGLYAIGETMAGVHGANRLGGNSLAETVAFGRVTGEAIARRLADESRGRPVGRPADRTLHGRARRHFANLERLTGREGTHDPEALLDDLRSVLEETAGIRRDGAALDRGLDAVEELQSKATDLDLGPRTGRAFEFALDLGFALVVAEALLRGARERTESRGAHFRTDYPETTEAWRHTLEARRDSVGAMWLTTSTPGEPSDAVRAALDADHELDYHQLE